MRYRRGIQARAECRDAAGRVLLVAGVDGRMELPGGPVGHGEHPADALARWVNTHTSAALAIRHPLRVVTDVVLSRPARGLLDPRFGWWTHSDTIVFAAELTGAGTGQWVGEAELAGLALASASAAALGRADAISGGPSRRVPWAALRDVGGRRQRFAAYGHVTDGAGNVLLTQIAAGYPGAGRWHLPGGGTDFGEPAPAGLYREIVEETAQRGTVGDLLRVSHRHQPAAPRVSRPGPGGRGGRAVDWHGVRVVYAVRVEHPSTPRVLEHGGSTSAAAWLPAADALGLDLTDVARDALAGPATA
jgi:ADP-ribose pyrophosphatase YjhB (NUDIX family)